MHAGKLADQVKTTIESDPECVGYVGIVDAETLERLDKLDDANPDRLAGCRKVRLSTTSC